MKRARQVGGLLACLWASTWEPAAAEPVAQGAGSTLEESFRPRGAVGLERLQQTPLQRICSRAPDDPLPPDLRQRVQDEALRSVRYPQAGQWLGNWQRGEELARSGYGAQGPGAAAPARGGNCYGCHQMAATEIAFGTLGPSLDHYLQRHGEGEEALRAAWTHLWNPHAFNACSVMPRFGDGGILSTGQLRDLMAYLFDPQSPVNR